MSSAQYPETGLNSVSSISISISVSSVSSVSSVNAKCCRYWDICGAQRNQNVTDNTCKKNERHKPVWLLNTLNTQSTPPTQRYFQPKLAPTPLSLLLGWGTIDTILKEIKYDFDVLQSYKFLQCRPVRPAQQSWEGLRGSEAIKRMVQTSETKGRNFHSDRMLLIFLFSLLIQRSTATNSIFTWKSNCWEGEESLQNFVLGILVT